MKGSNLQKLSIYSQSLKKGNTKDLNYPPNVTLGSHRMISGKTTQMNNVTAWIATKGMTPR